MTLEEFGSRVTDAYGAISRADLEPLLADLPALPDGPAPYQPTPGALAPLSGRRRGGKARRWLVAVLGDVQRKGYWRLPAKVNVVTLLSDTDLDLREAVIETADNEMRLVCVLSDQNIVVPEGVELEVSGFSFLGRRDLNVAQVRPRPGVPRLHIKVLGVLSDLKVTSAPPISHQGAGDDPAGLPPASSVATSSTS